MKTTTQDNFKFFVPLDIEKGLDETGQETMMIKGVASTNRKDSQGEILDVNGFDLTDFSVINWNHKGKDDAGAIIGEPTKAEIKNNKMHIEGMLYPEMPMAKAVFNLMKAYKNSPTGKRLGLSIEGKAITRDTLNPKRINRAKITGVAVCPHPINDDTTVDLLQKGFTHGEFEFDKDIIDALEKASDFWSLIDSDKGFKEYVASNNNEDKAIDNLGDITDVEMNRLLKAYTAAGNVHVSKESVEHDPKGISDYKQKNLSKSDVYEKIFDYFGPVETKTAIGIHLLVEKIAAMKNTPITEDTLKKAEEILNMSTEELIRKADEGGDKISDDDEGDSEEKEYDGDEGMEKASAAAMSALSKGTAEKDIVDKLTKGGLSIEKAQSCVKSCVEEMNRKREGGDVTTLQKSFESQANIIKGFGDSMDQKFIALFDIIKGQGADIKSLNEINKGLISEIETIGNQGAIRKSVPSLKAIDRFEKSENGSEVYQLSNQQSRGLLVQRLNEVSGLNGGDADKVNMQLARVAQDIELTHSITGPGISILKSHQIEVIK